MSKLRLTYLLCALLGLGNAKAQPITELVPKKNLLAEYISTGEVNLQWNSDKEVLIIASPHLLASTPNKKAYSHCTKFGNGASYEDGFIVYKGKKNAIVVSGLEIGEYSYFTSYTANEQGVFNVPGPALTSFVVWSLGVRAEINFKATTETAGEHFVIERSLDGINWDQLTKINASPELKGVVDYNFIDKGPLNGYYLYRLKQSNGAGYITSEPTPVETFSFSSVFEVVPQDEDPNNWLVVADVKTELSVTNSMGQIVRRITLSEENDFGYSIDDLPNGIYNINGFNSNGDLNSKITVNK
jgi:hypothetical protein